MKVMGYNVFISEDQERVVIKHNKRVSVEQANKIVRYLMDEDFIQVPTVKIHLVLTNLV